MAVRTDEELLRLVNMRPQPSRRSGMPKVVVMTLLVALYLLPFYYFAVTIFKSSAEYAAGGVLDLPATLGPVVDNLAQAWNGAGLGRAAFNSLTYGIYGSFLSVGFAAGAAYGLTRLRLAGAQAWFLLIFAGTLFPFQMYLVPLIFGYQGAGLAGSWLGMVLIYTAICIPFPLLVLRNKFLSIGRDIDEAARIDGAGEWTVFRSIVLPNAKGPIIALLLLQFTFIWNDLLFASVLANGENVRSVMVAMQTLQGTYSANGPNVVMAGALISSVPTVALLIALRKYFMSGLNLTS